MESGLPNSLYALRQKLEKDKEHIMAKLFRDNVY